MTMKRSKLESLPREIENEIVSYLNDIKDVGSLTRASRTTMSLASLFKLSFTEKKAAKLFKHVLEADYKKVINAVEHDPSVMLTKIKITNEDGNPERTSALNQACKVYDINMLIIFREAIEKHPLLWAHFIAQLEEKLSHITLEPLFSAYENYIQRCDNYLHHQITGKQLDQAWLALGMAQRRTLPHHMLKTFCDKHIHWAKDSFFDEIRPQTECKITDYVGNFHNRTLNLSKLGVVYSLIRSNVEDRWNYTAGLGIGWQIGLGLSRFTLGAWGGWRVGDDLTCFHRLLEMRANQFEEFMETARSLKRMKVDDRPSCVIS